MTHTAMPPPNGGGPLIQWFGASKRLIGGVPDSRYGWLDTPAGPCIIKALDTDLATYAVTLLEHERRMLARLQAMGAPAPGLVELGRTDWLATRFAGLSLRRMEHTARHRPRLQFAEQLAVWYHLLRRLQPLADAGVLIVDLHSANVVVPLTDGVQGQLRLHEVAVIDHAHTLEAGMNMRRPVWLDQHMVHIAPELKSAMGRDQQALRDRFGEQGAELPRTSRLPGERDQHSRRVWAEYDAPQQVQALLDAGQISPGHAMQYAIGIAMADLPLQAPNTRVQQILARIIDRLVATAPNERFPSMAVAAEALLQVVPAMPLASRAAWGRIGPADLAAGRSSAHASHLPLPQASQRQSRAGDDGTFLVTDIPPTGFRRSDGARAKLSRTGTPWRSLPMGWIYAAAACGAAAAMWMPVPW
jgi:hypothetical protein